MSSLKCYVYVVGWMDGWLKVQKYSLRIKNNMCIIKSVCKKKQQQRKLNLFQLDRQLRAVK